MSELPDTVYVAIWNDRHSDTAVYAFTEADDAVRWSRDQIRALQPDDLDEELTDAMREAGCLYYGCYSYEGDNIRVVPTQLRQSAGGDR